jgi:hypothetical protein
MEQKLRSIIENLQNSPLFQFSLGSKELFHSNFLAWCCENWRYEMGVVWRHLLPDLKDSSIKKGHEGVKREHKNHDLEVKFDSGELLVLELKVKSLPYEEQLEKYSNDKPSGIVHFALISPVCPPSFIESKFKLKDGTVWHWLNLKEVVSTVTITVKESMEKTYDPYKEKLLEDYNLFVINLSNLLEMLTINWSSNESFFIDKDVMEQFRNIRLHDLAYKYRYDQLAGKLNNEIGIMLQTAIKELEITSDMTRGTGLVTVKYSLTSDVFIGIQLQDRQFKQFILVKDYIKNKANLSELLVKCINELEEKSLWFNFSGKINDETNFHDKNMRKDICQYSGIFLYKYRLVREKISSNQLFELICEYTKIAHERREMLDNVIKKHLKAS